MSRSCRCQMLGLSVAAAFLVVGLCVDFLTGFFWCRAGATTIQLTERRFVAGATRRRLRPVNTTPDPSSIELASASTSHAAVCTSLPPANQHVAAAKSGSLVTTHDLSGVPGNDVMMRVATRRASSCDAATACATTTEHRRAHPVGRRPTTTGRAATGRRALTRATRSTSSVRAARSPSTATPTGTSSSATPAASAAFYRMAQSIEVPGTGHLHRRDRPRRRRADRRRSTRASASTGHLRRPPRARAQRSRRVAERTGRVRLARPTSGTPIFSGSSTVMRTLRSALLDRGMGDQRHQPQGVLAGRSRERRDGRARPQRGLENHDRREQHGLAAELLAEDPTRRSLGDLVE